MKSSSSIAGGVRLTTAIAGLSAVLALVLFAPAPVSAKDRCRNWGLPSFSCPSTASRNVCGVAPNLWCMEDGGDPDIDNCYSPTPAPNFVFDCATCQCQCDTANYPCSGCTEPVSVIGGSCGAAMQGRFTDRCGHCSDASGNVTLRPPPTVTKPPVRAVTQPSGQPSGQAGTQAVVQPGGPLSVTGDIRAGGDLYLPDAHAVRVDGSKATVLNIGNFGGGTFALRVQGQGSFDGRLGIGTSSPAYRLDVSGGIDSDAVLRLADTGGSRRRTGMLLSRQGSDAWYLGMGEHDDRLLLSRPGIGDYLAVDTAGNVAIGKPIPAYKLDVNGTVAAAGLVLNGEARSDWPKLDVITVQKAFSAKQPAGWRTVDCPSGYLAVGWSGYNCEDAGGTWQCGKSVVRDTFVNVYHDGQAKAYIWIRCLQLD